MHLPTLLLVDVPVPVHDRLAASLSPHGWMTLQLDVADDALDAIHAIRPDLVVCDLDGASGNGPVLARVLLSGARRAHVLALTGDAESLLARQARYVGWHLADRADDAAVARTALQALTSRLDGPSSHMLAPLPRIGAHDAASDAAFRRLLDASGTADLILTPDFRIRAVSSIYAACTAISPEDEIGRVMFEVFTDNPDRPDADGVANLRRSLQRASLRHRADAMSLQRYDVRSQPGGRFEERWWFPVNFPVHRHGRLDHIVHRAEDVTRFVKLRERLAATTVPR